MVALDSGAGSIPAVAGMRGRCHVDPESTFKSRSGWRCGFGFGGRVGCGGVVGSLVCAGASCCCSASGDTNNAQVSAADSGKSVAAGSASVLGSPAAALSLVGWIVVGRQRPRSIGSTPCGHRDDAASERGGGHETRPPASPRRGLRPRTRSTRREFGPPRPPDHPSSPALPVPYERRQTNGARGDGGSGDHSGAATIVRETDKDSFTPHRIAGD